MGAEALIRWQRLVFSRVISGEKLHARDGGMQRIGVFIYTDRFQEQDPQYDGSIFIPLSNV